MLATIHSYTEHTLLGIIVEGLPALVKNARDAVINHIALNIFVQVAISLPLWYLHQNLFGLGFVLGFIFDKQVKTIVEKVNVVYNANLTLLQRAFIFGGGGFFAILTMQMSLPIAACYYSAQWGALLYQHCLARVSSPSAPQTINLPTEQISSPQSQETVVDIQEPTNQSSPSSTTYSFLESDSNVN